MVLQDAFAAAQKFLDEVVRPDHRTEIVICRCEEVDDGWEFAYDSRAYLEEKKYRDALVGNGPVVVPRSGDAPFIRSVFRP